MRNILLVVMLLLLSSCSSQQVLIQKFTPSSLSAISSYSLFERESVFTEQQNISDVLRNNIELSIEKACEQIGYHYKPLSVADVVIAYELTGYAVLKPFTLNARLTANKGRVISAIDREFANEPQQYQGKHNRRLMAPRANGNPEDIVISILDANSLITLWQGQLPLGIKSDDNSQQLQVKIQQAVTSIMLAFQAEQGKE